MTLPLRRTRSALAALFLFATAACDDSGGAARPVDPTRVDPDTVGEPVALRVLGQGSVQNRLTAEVWARGDVAYTSTWGGGGSRLVGNVLNVWDVTGDQPVLVDSLAVENAGTLGDVQVSDDGRLLVVAVEPSPSGAIVLYGLEDPRRPRFITRYATPNTAAGVHTAEVARVNGTLYAFLSVDPAGSTPARLVVVDLSDPARPREVFAQAMGRPFIHDVFVRDGILFTAEWDDGLGIWDIGGGGRGGTPASPVRISRVDGLENVHNVWWFHDPATGSRRYAFVGEEQAIRVGSSSAGDVHVVDLGDLTDPREVGFFSVPGAGTHNFWMDEQAGILYAAYYNGGVRALDVRGDLGTCSDAERSPDGRCNLGLMGREVGRALTEQSAFIWGVHGVDEHLYASDMLNGLWKLDTAPVRAALRR